MYVLPRGSGAKDSVLPLLPRPSLFLFRFYTGIHTHTRTREICAISIKSVGELSRLHFREGMLLLTSRYKRGRRGRRVRYSIQASSSGGVLASKLIHSITKTNEIPFLPSICVNSVYIRIPRFSKELLTMKRKMWLENFTEWQSF